MQQIIFNVLTKKTMRSKRAIARQLRSKIVAGAPWYDAAPQKIVTPNL